MSRDDGILNMTLTLRPITFRDTCVFVKKHHRHHKPPQGHKGSVAVEYDGRLCGVAMVGRPVSRHLDDNTTAEVIRLCTDGTRNACSKLYSAAATLAKGFGYKRVITYIREDEPGTSLKASGWKYLGEAGGGQWSCRSRPSAIRTTMDRLQTTIPEKNYTTPTAPSVRTLRQTTHETPNQIQPLVVHRIGIRNGARHSHRRLLRHRQTRRQPKGISHAARSDVTPGVAYPRVHRRLP